MNKKQIIIGLVALALIGMIAGLGVGMESKKLKKRVKSIPSEKVTEKIEKSKPLSYEEAIKQMKEKDIKEFSPQVPSLIEEIRRKMKNKTLCPPDKEDMSILYLGRSRDPRGVPILIEVIKNYEIIPARIQAIEALGMIRDRSVIPLLEDLLEDKEIKIRLSAAYTLVDNLVGFNEKNLKTLPIFIAVLKSNLSAGFKQTALDGLEKIGNDEAITAIGEALNDKDKLVQRFALYNLKEIGNEKAISYIKKALSSEYKEVREKAQEMLKEIERKSN